MLTRFSRSFVALVICYSIGGHWIGLQSIAWASMVVNYSQQCSIAKAIERTFDGEHPCDLCKHISKARDTEKKQDSRSLNAKADLICTTRRVVLLPPFSYFDYPDLISSVGSSLDRTPYPPPRAKVV
jgi:hypothetical protein